MWVVSYDVIFKIVSNPMYGTYEKLWTWGFIRKHNYRRLEAEYLYKKADISEKLVQVATQVKKNCV